MIFADGDRSRPSWRIGFLWCIFYGFGFFWFFSLLGFFLGFRYMLSFGCQFHVYFVVVFSARVLGAGFRPGVFTPTVSTALTMGWTGWKFVAAITIAVTCYFCTYYFGLRPQLETKFKI